MKEGCKLKQRHNRTVLHVLIKAQTAEMIFNACITGTFDFILQTTQVSTEDSTWRVKHMTHLQTWEPCTICSLCLYTGPATSQPHLWLPPWHQKQQDLTQTLQGLQSDGVCSSMRGDQDHGNVSVSAVWNDGCACLCKSQSCWFHSGGSCVDPASQEDHGFYIIKISLSLSQLMCGLQLMIKLWPSFSPRRGEPQGAARSSISKACSIPA